MVGSENTGVKQIPELQHHEDREELQVRACPTKSAGICLIITMNDISMARKQKPTPSIFLRMALVMMKSLVLRGFSFMTSALGGIDAKAMAAKVSIIRFTQSI